MPERKKSATPADAGQHLRSVVQQGGLSRVDSGIHEKPALFREIDSAWDLSSGGLGIHCFVLDQLVAGEIITYTNNGMIEQIGSNYLCTNYSYVWGGVHQSENWMHADVGNVSPRNEAHVRLFRTTFEDYEVLLADEMRLVFVGEDALREREGTRPTRDELEKLLALGVSKRLIQYVPDDSFNIQSSLDRGAYLDGTSVTLEGANAFREVDFGRLRPKLVQAGIHKLGAMLALTDQLTYDASTSGVPFTKGYKPDRVSGKGEMNWQAYFGYPLPDLEGLWRKAHETLLRHADPQDPLVAHLIALTTLEQLAA